MIRISIKPLSLNQAYHGRRFATKDLVEYKRAVYYLLPKKTYPKGNLALSICFGMSNKGSDIDNCVKCFMDVLSEKYNFNDNRIYKLQVEKIDCKKGEEFIDFDLLLQKKEV